LGIAWDFKVKTLQVENNIANLDKPDKVKKEFENVRVYVWILLVKREIQT